LRSRLGLGCIRARGRMALGLHPRRQPGSGTSGGGTPAADCKPAFGSPPYESPFGAEPTAVSRWMGVALAGTRPRHPLPPRASVSISPPRAPEPDETHSSTPTPHPRLLPRKTERIHHTDPPTASARSTVRRIPSSRSLILSPFPPDQQSLTSPAPGRAFQQPPCTSTPHAVSRHAFALPMG
jgi:hypothetical protein